MGELGVLGHADYKITSLFDDRAMITVQSPKYGVFNCKPLQVVWGLFSDFYTPKNTIMFDDLRRNFIMNPQNGLRIKPFKNAPTEGKNDDELVHLTQYLNLIASKDDLSELDHARWRRFLDKSNKK
jgi:ubiquitin-like domain-containing CTD phosphatase 1